MWSCPKCGRIFEKIKQGHSCQRVPLEQHFKNKENARELFEYLVEQIREKIGQCKIISIPCCIHLFGGYDFLAALPKKNELEIRFALNRCVVDTRVKQTVQLSSHSYKNCIDIKSREDIDEKIIDWLKESYNLKDKNRVCR